MPDIDPLTRLSHDHAIAVVDGNCALCSRSANLIARYDSKDRVRICTSQSAIGGRLLTQAGLDPTDPTSWLVFHKGVLHTEMDGAIYLGGVIGGIGHLAKVFYILPRRLRRWIYHKIATNRIAWFGTADLCAMPSDRLRAKLLIDP